LIEIKAPEVILRNEKRMLQESVDSLFDNSRKSSAVKTESNRPLEHVEVQISGVGSTYTDEDGYYSIEIGNSNRTANVRLQGSYINTNNSSGNDAVITRTVSPGTTEDFVFTNVNSIPSERDTYYHANLIHDWQKALDPSFTGADYQMPANRCKGATSPLNTALKQCDDCKSTTTQDHDSG